MLSARLTVPALFAFAMLTPPVLLAQEAPRASVGNYKLVSERPAGRTQWFATYRAELQTNGVANPGSSATLSSLVPSVRIVPGQGKLNFGTHPSNGRTSSNTFTILVDRSKPFTFSDLKWSFLTPSANAGRNQTVKIGANVELNAGESSDPSGVGNLKYSWTLLSKPAESAASLSNATSVKPTFVVDAAGDYSFEVKVDNGVEQDTATVTISTVNSAPMARAGRDQTAPVGTIVRFSGGNSSDADGDPLRYSWTMVSQPEGSKASIAASSSVTGEFAPDKPGDYILQLVVNDGLSESAPATVTITTVNSAPVASADAAGVLKLGEPAQINGSRSTDVDGDALTYEWKILSAPAGSGALLSSTSDVNPSITPDVAGSYVAQLVVSDGKMESAPATVVLSTAATGPLTANAGMNQTVARGNRVVLRGSANGVGESYQWSLIARPENSEATLSDANSATPSFVADQPGTYVAQLITSNGRVKSAPKTVTIDTTNTQPVADAGVDVEAALNSTVTLDATTSSDADKDQLAYNWSLLKQPADSNATLVAATSSNPSIVPDAAGTYVLQLIVNDGFSNSDPVTKTILASAEGPGRKSASSVDLIVTPILTVAPGDIVPFSVALASPAVNSVFIQLTSSDPATAALSTTGVSINAGQTSPSRGANLTGVAAGTATITATATGMAPASTLVTVGITSSLSPAITNLSGPGADATLTLALSGRAQNNIGFAISSSNPSVAFVPSNAFISASGQVVGFKVTAVGIGTTIIRASAPGFADATATITVLPSATISLSVNTNSIKLGQAPATLTATLSQPAPFGGTTIALGFDNKKLLCTPANIFIPQGATTGSSQVAGENVGNHTITAASAGYGSPAPIVMQVGAVIAWERPSVTLTTAGQQLQFNLILFSTVPGSNAFSVLDGISINISSSNTAVATVQTPVNFFWDGSTAPATRVTINTVGFGLAQIHASGVNIDDVVMNLNVNGPLGFGFGAFPNGSAGLPYSFTMTPNGGTAPYTWTATGLPPGLTLNSSTGVISGTAASLGTSTVNCSVSDSTVPKQTVTGALTLTMDPAPPSLISMVSGSPQSGAIGTAFGSPLVARVTDTAGNPVANINIIFSGPSTGAGIASPVTVGTNASGIATAFVTANSTVGGPYQVTASAAGIGPASLATPAAFFLTNTGSAPVPATITTISGSPQTATVGATFASPLVVEVKDATGALLSGVTVTFRGPNSGAGIANTITAVTVAGRASVQVTANSSVGTNYQVTASVTGLAATATFALSNAAAIPATISVVSGGGQSTAVGTAFSAPLIALVLDSASRPVPNAPVTFAGPSSGASIASPVTVSTDAAGQASVVVSANAIANGPYNVSASVGSVVPVNFPLTNTAASSGGIISLPSNVVLAPGQTLPFAITLPTAAPGGGVTVTLTSADPSKVTITPPSVFIGAGLTQPAAQPQVTGVNIGSAVISASAPNYTTGSKGVTVTATISLSPGSLNLTGTATQNLTLTLSAPAPAAGLTFTLSSSNTAAATVPASVTIGAGLVSVNVPVTGVATGSSVVRASFPGITDATANVTVAAGAAVDFIMPGSITLAPNTSVDFPITLARSQANSVYVQLTTSDSSKATITGGVTFNAGQTTPSRTVVLNGNALGSATITASTNGLAPASTLVTVGLTAALTPANSVLVGPGADVTLALRLSGPIPADTIFTLTSSNPSVAIVPQLLFLSRSSSVIGFKVTAVGIGTAVIRATAPGFADSTANVTVGSPATSLMALSTNQIKLAQAPATLTVTLSQPAPFGGTTVTLGFDNKKVNCVPSTIVIPEGATTGTSQVFGENVGNHTITGSLTGGYTAPAPVVMQVGAIIAWETPNLSVGSVGQQLQFNLLLFATVPGNNAFSILDGIPINISSSNTNVATVQTPVNFFWDGSTVPATRVTVNILSSGTTQLHASGVNIADVVMNLTVNGPVSVATASLPNGSVGASYSATLSAVGGTSPYTWTATGLPAGLSLNSSTGAISGTPTAAGTTGVTFTVSDASNPQQVATANMSLTVSGGLSGGTILLPFNVNVTPGQSAAFPVSLTSPAPVGVTVALSTSDSTKVSITPSSVTISAGQTQPVSQPVVTGVNFGSASISASATGYTTGTQVVTVPGSLSFAPSTLTLVGASPQNLTITLPAPTATGLTVTLSANQAGVISIPASVSIAAGSSSATFAVTGVSTGSAVITASNPNVASATASVIVQGGGAISVTANPTVVMGQTTPLQITLPTVAPAGGLTVTLSSSDSTKVTVVPSTVTIAAGSTQPASAPQLTGLAPGSAIITASAPFFTSGSAPLQVTTSISFSPATLAISGGGVQNLTLTLANPAPPTGLTFAISSSNTAAATVPASVTIAAGLTSATVPVTGAAGGTATIRASAAGITDATATVTVTATADIIMPANFTVSPNASVDFPITLARPAAGTVYVALTSSDSSKANVTGGVTFNAGQTTPSRSVVISGLAAGTTTINATSSGLNAASTIVTVGTSATLSPSAVSLLGPGTDATLTLSLSGPAQSTTTFTLTSSNPSVAIVGPSVTFGATGQVIGFKLTAIGVGTTVIRATAPGYADVTSDVTVQPPSTITLSANTNSIKLAQAPATLTATLSQPAPFGGTRVQLGFDNKKLNLVPSTIFIPQGATAGIATVSGENVGNHTITATATNYTPATPFVMQVGAVIAWENPNVSVNTIGQQLQYNLLLFATVPGSNAFSILDGIPANISSSNTAVATVQTPVNFFWDGSSVPATRVTVNIIGSGVAQLHASGVNIADVVMNLTVNGPIAVASTTLTSGTVGTPYSFTMAAAGGQQPYSWTATGLPAGLTMSSAGIITGTPTSAGTTSFNATVRDTSNPQQAANSTLSLTISAAVATSVAVSAGNNQTGAVNSSFSQLVALVTDSASHPLPGITVTFTGPSGTVPGIAAAVTAVTDASGLASATVTANSRAGGPYNVNATIFGVSTPAVFSLTNTPGPAASIVVVSGSGQSATVTNPFPQGLRAQVKDSGGNPVSGVPVTFAAPSGSGPSATFTTALIVNSDVFGNANIGSPTANTKAGPFVVTASVAGAATPASFSLTNNPGSAASIAISSGNPQSATTNTLFITPLAVVVSDSFGNPVPAVDVLFTAPSSGQGATLSSPTATTNASGVASVTATANATAGVYVVTASINGASQAFNLTNIGPLPGSVTATAGAVQTAPINASFASPLTVKVLGVSGPAVGATVTFTVVPNNGAAAVLSIPAVTDSNGFASVTATANSIGGTYTVAATASGIGGTATFSLTNTLPSAIALTATPQSLVAGSSATSTLAATVTDASARPVPGVVVTFAAPASQPGAMLSAVTAVTNASGVASVTAAPRTLIGQYQISATAGALSTTVTMTNVAGPAANIAVVSGTPQTAAPGIAFSNPLKVLVTDNNSNPVVGATVVFTAPAASGASGTFAGTANTAVTGATGVATSAVFTANASLGTYNVTGAVTGVAGSVSFALTNGAQYDYIITKVSGDGQASLLNSPFNEQLVVKVTKADGTPVRGATVSFAATVGNTGASASVGGGSQFSDDLGLIYSPTLTANGTLGAYTVTATLTSVQTPGTLPPPVAFSLQNSIFTGGAGKITIPALTIGKDLQTLMNVSFSPAAPAGGVVFRITSDSPNVLLGGGAVKGRVLVQDSLVQGLNLISIFVQALDSTGTATVRVEATGYDTATATITMTPSGFVISGPGIVGAPFTVYQGSRTDLKISAVRLDPVTLNPAAVQQVRGGLSINVPLSLSDGNIGGFAGTANTPFCSLKSANVNFIGADDIVTTQFQACGVTTGPTTITTGIGAGSEITSGIPVTYGVPATGQTVIATVLASDLIPSNVTVGRFLQAPATISLTGASTADIQATISTTDPNIRFSNTATGAGTTSIVVSIPPNHSISTGFYIQAVGNATSANYTMTATGFAPANGTVTIAPSGLRITSPGGAGAASFDATVASGDAILTVETGRFSGGQFIETQAVAGGTSLTTSFANSNPSVATLGSSSLTIPGGASNGSFAVHPLGVTGSTTITATSAALTSAAVIARISNTPMFFFGHLTVGNKLQDIDYINLPGPAGSGGTTVTITAAGPGILLSATATGAGSSSITLSVLQGSSQKAFYVQGTTSSGTVNYTATSSGLASATATATLAPSAMVIYNHFGSSTVTAPVGTNSDVIVQVGILQGGVFPIIPKALAGGSALTVQVSSSSASVTIPNPVTIQPGSDQGTVTLSLNALGGASVTIPTQPTGFSDPGTLTSVSVTVN